VLVIDAAGPDFAAYDPHRHRRNQHWFDVRIADENSADMSSILKRRIEAFSASEDLEPQFNFSRIRLYVDYNGKRMPVTTLYTAYDNAGRLTKLMDCRDRPNMYSPFACQYRFLNEGLMFNLGITDPSQWQGIEQGLAKMLASFEPYRSH
jgi:hypothetical protein